MSQNTPTPEWAHEAVAAIAHELMLAVAAKHGRGVAHECFEHADPENLAEVLMRHAPVVTAVPEPETLSTGLGRKSKPLSSGLPSVRPHAMPQNDTPFVSVIRKLVTAKAQRVKELASKLNATPEIIEAAVSAPDSGLEIRAGGWVGVKKGSDS